MSPLGIFRKKEKGAEPSKSESKTLLEELCEDNKELYEVLRRTILLNPEITLKEGIDSYLGKAEEYEKAGDHVRARVAYQTAGEIFLYEGKVADAQKFFKKAAEIDPNYEHKKVFEYFNRKENAQRAMVVAREFYAKSGKRVEKT